MEGPLSPRSARGGRSDSVRYIHPTMRRVWFGALIASAIGVVVAACDGGGDWVYYGGGGYANCSLYTSCDTCTPVAGCGWCGLPGGSGVCTTDPDYCPTQEFSWTWEPKGCRVAADASIVEAGGEDSPADASAEGATPDAGGGGDAAHRCDGAANSTDC